MAPPSHIKSQHHQRKLSRYTRRGQAVRMKLGLLAVLAVATLVPHLSESRTLTKCELKSELEATIKLPKKFQYLTQKYLALVICALERQNLNTDLVELAGDRMTDQDEQTTTKPATAEKTTTPPSRAKLTTAKRTTKPTTAEKTTTPPSRAKLTTAKRTTKPTTAEKTTTPPSRAKLTTAKRTTKPTTAEETTPPRARSTTAKRTTKPTTASHHRRRREAEETTPEEPDYQETPPEDSEDQETPPEDSEDQETPPEDSEDQETPPEDSEDQETPPEDSEDQETPPEGLNQEDAPESTPHDQNIADLLSTLEYFVDEKKLNEDNYGPGSEGDDGSSWSLGKYGIYQLTDGHHCNSAYRTSSNVCRASCEDLTDDDISDDTRCFTTSYYHWWYAMNAGEHCIKQARHHQRYFRECQ